MATLNNLATSDKNCDRLTIRIISRLKHGHPDLWKKLDNLSLSMDLAVCYNKGHANLAALLELDPRDFVHDIIGIVDYLNRKTGEMNNCFVPRSFIPKGNR